MYIFMLVQKQRLQRYKYNGWVVIRLIYNIVICRSYIQSINTRVKDKFNLQFEPQMTK